MWACIHFSCFDGLQVCYWVSALSCTSWNPSAIARVFVRLEKQVQLKTSQPRRSYLATSRRPIRVSHLLPTTLTCLKHLLWSPSLQKAPFLPSLFINSRRHTAAWRAHFLEKLRVMMKSHLLATNTSTRQQHARNRAWRHQLCCLSATTRSTTTQMGSNTHWRGQRRPTPSTKTPLRNNRSAPLPSIHSIEEHSFNSFPRAIIYCSLYSCLYLRLFSTLMLTEVCNEDTKYLPFDVPYFEKLVVDLNKLF